VTAGSDTVLSSAGASLLLSTARAAGLGQGLSAALAPWRRPGAVHDPGKVVFDLAVAVALGGDCLADLAVVRAQPELFGTVASDATVSRLLERLSSDVKEVIAAIRTARAAARERVWRRRDPLPAAGPVIVDLDATLVTAHSDKEHATPTFKRGYGFHPLLAFVDHDPASGTGEPLAGMLRAGNAGANTAADQIAVLDAALAQLPEPARSRLLVRGDTSSGVKAFLAHVHQLGLGYSVGMYGQAPLLEALEQVPRQAWRDAREPDGTRRDGAQVAELTRWLPASFTGWPPGIRVIARRERPHPGAQLRITDHAGWRITMFATNTKGGRIADLEVRHRLRARAEDRIRTLKDTGLRNLPLHAFAKNQLWLEIASLAAELLTFTQTLAWHGKPACRWEPKRLRLRLLSVAARLVRSGRRATLRINQTWPWAKLLTTGQQRLAGVT
jgi:hypothetical protein